MCLPEPASEGPESHIFRVGREILVSRAAGMTGTAMSLPSVDSTVACWDRLDRWGGIATEAPYYGQCACRPAPPDHANAGTAGCNPYSVLRSASQSHRQIYRSASGKSRELIEQATRTLRRGPHSAEYSRELSKPSVAVFLITKWTRNHNVEATGFVLGQLRIHPRSDA